MINPFYLSFLRDIISAPCLILLAYIMEGSSPSSSSFSFSSLVLSFLGSLWSGRGQSQSQGQDQDQDEIILHKTKKWRIGTQRSHYNLISNPLYSGTIRDEKEIVLVLEEEEEEEEKRRNVLVSIGNSNKDIQEEDKREGSGSGKLPFHGANYDYYKIQIENPEKRYKEGRQDQKEDEGQEEQEQELDRMIYSSRSRNTENRRSEESNDEVEGHDKKENEEESPLSKGQLIRFFLATGCCLGK